MTTVETRSLSWVPRTTTSDALSPPEPRLTVTVGGLRYSRPFASTVGAGVGGVPNVIRV
jgi:hypothetical protein